MYTLLAVAAVALITARLIWQVIYNLFFHPLRKFPGPVAFRATRLTYIYHYKDGRFHHRLRDLHENYGRVVRIAPDELSFSDETAWKDIYGHRIGAQGTVDENEKWIVAYAGTKNAPRSMFSAPRAEHAYLRKLVSHGFSDRNLRAQEPLIRSHVDLLVAQLRKECEDGTKRVNMRNWLTYATFDIIGDLGFGATFNTLRSPERRAWTDSLGGQDGASFATISTLRRMVLPDWLCDLIKKYTVSQVSSPLMGHVKATLAERMEMNVQRPDLVSGLVSTEKDEIVPPQTIMLTAGLLMGAGFETTASLINGALYLLLRNPDSLKKLTDEVRSAFATPADIKLAELDKLPYLIACLQEALRWYPPAAAAAQRQVMKGGATIAGRFVPEDSIVAVPHWAAYHSPSHFTKADGYHPERWMGDAEFADDNLDIVQPFLVGPRNCVGRNLAMAEMRLILGLLVYNFDFKMPDEFIGWAEGQRSYQLWARGPLDMYLTPASSTTH